MKKPNRLLPLAMAVLGLSLCSGTLLAQGAGGGGRQRGNFDPAQMRQRMNERLRERLDVKDDAEWNLIEQRLTKVMEAQRATRMGGMGAMMGGRGGRGGQGGRPGGQSNRPGSESSPEATALQSAIESNASAADIQAKLAKYREARKAKEATLQKAREDLKQVLSAKQEATCVLMGILE